MTPARPGHISTKEAPIASGPGWALLLRIHAGPFTVTQKAYRPEFRQELHAHDHGSVDFNLAGRGSGVCAGQMMESVPGAVELFAPNVEHSFACGPQGIRTMHVSFGAAVLPADRRNDPHRTAIDQASAVGLASQLLEELKAPDASTPLAAEALATELVAVMQRWRDKGDPDARWLTWVRERLHAGGTPSLHELARLAGVHRAHLARSFAKQYGVSVGEYHRRLRLAGVARRIAASPRTSLAAVAGEAGFADQAHLTRWFKRIAGVTPAAYARAMRQERDSLACSAVSTP